MRNMLPVYPGTLDKVKVRLSLRRLESGLQLHDVTCRGIAAVTTATQNGIYRGTARSLWSYGHFLLRVLMISYLFPIHSRSVQRLQIRMFD